MRVLINMLGLSLAVSACGAQVVSHSNTVGVDGSASGQVQIAGAEASALMDGLLGAGLKPDATMIPGRLAVRAVHVSCSRPGAPHSLPLCTLTGFDGSEWNTTGAAAKSLYRVLNRYASGAGTMGRGGVKDAVVADGLLCSRGVSVANDVGCSFYAGM